MGQRGMRLGATKAKMLEDWAKAPMTALRWKATQAFGCMLQVDQKAKKPKRHRMKEISQKGWHLIHRQRTRSWITVRGGNAYWAQMFECEIYYGCYGLQKEDDIPGAPISDSTLRSKEQPHFVAPPGRGDESGMLSA